MSMYVHRPEMAEMDYNAICNCGEQWVNHNWVSGKAYKSKEKNCTGFVKKKEEPTFKVGDIIRHKGDINGFVGTITEVHGPGSTRPGSTRPGYVETSMWLNKADVFELVREAPQEEIEVTPQGGKHTAIGRAYHHFPPHAMRLMAETLHKGALKYNEPFSNPNWKNISKEDHHNHALNHIFLALENNETEDYVNAALRGIMALQMHLEEKNG